LHDATKINHIKKTAVLTIKNKELTDRKNNNKN